VRWYPKQSSLFGLLVSLSGLIYIRATSLPQESLNFNACSRLFLSESGFSLSYVLLSRFDGSVWNNGSSPPVVALAASRPTASGESLVRDTAFEGGLPAQSDRMVGLVFVKGGAGIDVWTR
jgi:hypothetical protein